MLERGAASRVSRARDILRGDLGREYRFIQLAAVKAPERLAEMRGDYYGTDMDYMTFATKWAKYPVLAAAIVDLR